MNILLEKLVELYLKRIEVIDKDGPVLNSVLELNPDALSIARELDKEFKSGKIRGPLHGIPILIKDIDIVIRCKLLLAL
jgi:amidase